MTDLLLYVFGGVGALIYAFPMYLANKGKVPPEAYPLPALAFAVFTGAVLAPLLAPMLGQRWPFMVDPEPYPLAFVLGLLANPIVPVFVRKATGWAEAYQIGGKK